MFALERHTSLIWMQIILLFQLLLVFYLSVIVLVLSFLLQRASFDILGYKTKQQSFRQLYLFNFRTFEVSNHTNLN